ncbi:MAG: Ig-like domain-containing protein, partial [Planctomycetota bacterium]
MPATATGQGSHYVSYDSSGIKTISVALQDGSCFGYVERTVQVVENYTTPGSIIGDENLCSTITNPAQINTESSPNGGFGGTRINKWQRRLADGAGGWGAWMDISGASSTSYNPPPISVSTQYRRGVRRSPCSDWIYSNEVTKSLSSMPIANGDYYESACPGFVYTNNVSYNDQQLNSPSYTLVALPNNGTIDLDPDGEFIYTPNSTFCGTDQFTYSVCNQYSNCCDTASVVIDLSDPEAPVLNGIPTDIIVHCDEEIPLPPLVEAYENCQSVTIGLDQVTTQGNDSCSIYSYDLTRIWTGLDYCGNSAVDQQQISIQDLTAPDIFRVYTLPNGKQMVAGVMENVTQRWKT